MSEPEQATESADAEGDVTQGGSPTRSYIEKWLAAQPAQHLALAFVDPEQYPGHLMLAALEQEIVSAAYGIREPHVALNKLNWWGEELSTAASGGECRHPLVQGLFMNPQARSIPLRIWLAPTLAAMAQLEEGTSADFAAQLAAATPLHGALAELETAWWFGPAAITRCAARVAVLSHVLHTLRRLQDDVERDRLPLPMAQLARHGLARADLGKRSPARDQAIQAQLADLRAAWRAAAQLPGPLSVFRALESRESLALLRRAQRADDPLKALQQDRRTGLGAVFATWRAARRWRRSAPA